MRNRPGRAALVAVLAVCAVTAVEAIAREDAGDLIRRARREATAGRFAEAESTYARAARIARDEQRGEAVFGQAGLTRSANEAGRLYESLADDPRVGVWAQRAALELAKIHFAMGRYKAAGDVIRASRLSSSSDEAALFLGIASVMAGDFESAIPPLEGIRRGRYRTWAMVTLAEAEAGAGRVDEACRLYESLAQARVNPAAWYRYGECLEADGKPAAAREEYAALAEAYPQTPEAIRCAGKLSPAPETPPPPREDSGTTAIPAGKGYTIQFGSFTDRANAIRLATRVKEIYPGVRIDSELVNYREVFRVRFGYYASRDEADAAGKEMAERLDERYTVMPVRPTP
jgi:tetratricopeptide (TPR) repeat protein